MAFLRTIRNRCRGHVDGGIHAIIGDAVAEESRPATQSTRNVCAESQCSTVADEGQTAAAGIDWGQSTYGNGGNCPWWRARG